MKRFELFIVKNTGTYFRDVKNTFFGRKRRTRATRHEKKWSSFVFLFEKNSAFVSNRKKAEQKSKYSEEVSAAAAAARRNRRSTSENESELDAPSQVCPADFNRKSETSRHLFEDKHSSCSSFESSIGTNEKLKVQTKSRGP